MNKAHDIHTCKCGDCIGELQLFYQSPEAIAEAVAMSRQNEFIRSLSESRMIAAEMSIGNKTNFFIDLTGY